MATRIPKNRATFTLDAIVRATAGFAARGKTAETATGVTTDSRAVSIGEIFVALRGDAHDGHDFAAAAARSGARILVLDRRGHEELAEADRAALAATSVVVVVVEDTLVA